MSLGPTGDSNNSFEKGKKKAEESAGKAASTGASVANAVKNIDKIKEEAGALKTLLKNPGAFFGNIENVGYALPAVFALLVLLILVGLTVPSILQQTNAKKKEGTMAYSINYQAAADPDELVFDYLDQALDKDYDDAIDDVKNYMINDAQEYGCSINEQVALYDKIGYETEDCQVLLVMGPKDVDNDKRSSYTKQGFAKLLTSRMQAVNGFLNKFNDETVAEGRTPTIEETMTSGVSGIYTDWVEPAEKEEETPAKAEADKKSVENKDDAVQKNVEHLKDAIDEMFQNKENDPEGKETSSLQDAGKGSLLQSFVTVLSADDADPEEASDVPENAEQTDTSEESTYETDSGKTETDEKPEKSDDKIDYSRIDDPEYMPEVLKKHGNEYTNLYSEKAIEYLKSFQDDDHKIVWAASEREWEAELTSTDTLVEQGVCEAYVQNSSDSSAWVQSTVGCSTTKSQPNIRPMYSNAQYEVIPEYDQAQITDRRYLYWTDSIGFFKKAGTLDEDYTASDGTVIPAGTPINSDGIAYEEVMKEYGFTENDISNTGALKCYRGDTLLTFAFPQDSDLYRGDDRASLDLKELDRITRTAHKKIVTYYVPFYYDLFDYHGEEVENVKKAIQFRDPDNPMDQEEASQYVDDMIMEYQRQYAQQYGFEDMLDTIEMKRYERPHLGSGVSEMLFDGEYKEMSGWSGSEITWHSIMEEITAAGQSYFGNQCTDFAKWRFLRYYGWVYATGGNGNMVAPNIVDAYPDKFELVRDIRDVPAGSIFSLKTWPWGHVGFIEKVEDGMVWVSEGNYDRSWSHGPEWGHSIQINRVTTIEEWESQGPFEYACPKPEYIQELKGSGDSESGGSSDYVVKVNSGTNVVTVYRNGSPYKAFRCSVNDGVGNGYIATPVGEGTLTHENVNGGGWHLLINNEDGTGNYSRWCSRMAGSYGHSGYLIHCVTNTEPEVGTLRVNEYNKLGTYASHGCVRLQAAYAKWIYDNCEGSKFIVFFGTSADDPITPMSVSKISVSESDPRYGWDPTDPTPGNPWKTHGNISH